MKDTSREKSSFPLSPGAAGKIARTHRDGLGHHLRTTHRMMHRLLQDRIEPYGVTIGMWYFLRALWRKDGIILTELCRHVGTMAPTAVIALNAMEAAGLISRRRDESDRRCVNIYLTEKGREMEELFRPVAEGVSEAALAGLQPQQRHDLIESLKLIQRNLSPLVPNMQETVR